MEWIIVGVIAFFLISKMGGFAAQTAQPINQATGSSIGQALGNASAPPSYYSTGNPQYNAGRSSTSPPALPVESQTSAPPSQSAAPSPIASRTRLTSTQLSNIRRAGEANVNAPPIVQPVAVRTRVVSPETASAFWTKTPINVRRPSTY